MRDNALAGALKRLGHSVTLIPLYTPLRSEQPLLSESEVFYGGVNVYLQHAARLFRHTPRVLDWVFDRPWLLNAAGKVGAQTPPEKLAGLTLEILEGEDGAAAKELRRLVDFLRDHVKPQVVSLPNLMFVGMARVFRRELGVPVVCELTGEDIFLDAMAEQDRPRVREVIRRRAGDVTRFVATSDSYAIRMAEYLDLPREQIEVVYSGIAERYFTDPPAHRSDHGPTVGYLARICPEKGLGRLIDAMEILRTLPGMDDVRLKVAGYVGGRDAKWYAALQKRAAGAGLGPHIDWLGEVDRAAKLAMLDSIDVFTVPTAYPEPKGIYILEAMARGVPVVQPAHGSFPELLGLTGGGVLVPPGDASALAHTIAELLRDEPRRRELGEIGRETVRAQFTEELMAEGMVRVFESVALPKVAQGAEA
jgi:glycosyltransferase involved in cell wall biosynthesis